MTVAQTQKIIAYTMTPTLDTSAYADGDVMGTSATGVTLYSSFPPSRAILGSKNTFSGLFKSCLGVVQQVFRHCYRT